ncbi:hypothetical protein EYF80_057300 [Liparis tanakae]|uniref:Uncharacterized protein n=1 Tax=Liparis tanakae TaxID=230148 RepID=A0A4Z2EV62_9TELE|nr:hypothetical protein EYF80_057300 [Liparis tanakae]
MDFAGLTQIQAAARRSRQPEVFPLYSGSDLGITEAGLERAGEDGEAGADPFLQASDGDDAERRHANPQDGSAAGGSEVTIVSAPCNLAFRHSDVCRDQVHSSSPFSEPCWGGVGRKRRRKEEDEEGGGGG